MKFNDEFVVAIRESLCYSAFEYMGDEQDHLVNHLVDCLIQEFDIIEEDDYEI